MILLIDNFDSFVYNLARYVEELGARYLVKRNNEISIEEIISIRPSHIIISPGPCTPNESGISMEVLRYFTGKIPILGVCLGHQCIGQYFGGRIVKALSPMHGKTCLIKHSEKNIFQDIPNPLKVCRYHSLIIENNNLPECLEVTAVSAENEIMAIQHTSEPIFGVQFHPEAILTDHGYQMLDNFVNHVYANDLKTDGKICRYQFELESESLDNFYY